MTHDVTHCLDMDARCSPACFRCLVTRDLGKRPDLIGVPLSWAHFKGTEECLNWPKREKGGTDGGKV